MSRAVRGNILRRHSGPDRSGVPLQSDFGDIISSKYCFTPFLTLSLPTASTISPLVTTQQVKHAG